MPSKRPLPKDAVLIPKNATRVFQGKIFDVYQWPQKLFDGTTDTFEMLKRPDTIVVLGVVEGKVVLLEQEQPTKPMHWTLPAGRVDEGETPLQTAKREMKEETGMTFKNWELKDVHQFHTKFEWFIYFFVAQDLEEKTEQALDGGEKISVELVEYPRVVELVQKGAMLWAYFLLKKILNGQTSLNDILEAPALEIADA